MAELRTRRGAELHRVARGFSGGRTRSEVLFVVAVAGIPTSVGEVAEATGVTQQVAGGHLRKLNAAGLLDRESRTFRHERSDGSGKIQGGRCVFYSPTPLAERLLRAVFNDEEGEP